MDEQRHLTQEHRDLLASYREKDIEIEKRRVRAEVIARKATADHNVIAAEKEALSLETNLAKFEILEELDLDRTDYDIELHKSGARLVKLPRVQQA